MTALAIKSRPAPLPKDASSKVFFYLRLGFGALLLLALFRMLDLAHLAATIASVNPVLVALGLLAMMSNLLVKTYRWGMILRRQIPDVSFGRLAGLNFASLFLGNFLPTSFSHDFVRVYHIARGRGDVRAAVSSIFADRVIGNFSVAVAAIAAFVPLILYRHVATAFMANPGLNGLIVGVLLVLLGALLALRGWQWRTPWFSWQGSVAASRVWLCLGVVVVAVAGYVLLTPLLGFPIVSSVMLTLLIGWLTGGRWLLAVIVALVATLAIWLAFAELLRVPLGLGILERVVY